MLKPGLCGELTAHESRANLLASDRRIRAALSPLPAALIVRLWSAARERSASYAKRRHSPRILALPWTKPRPAAAPMETSPPLLESLLSTVWAQWAKERTRAMSRFWWSILPRVPRCLRRCCWTDFLHLQPDKLAWVIQPETFLAMNRFVLFLSVAAFATSAVAQSP